MKLEVGKRYVLRNGETIGPLSEYGGGEFRFTARDNRGRRLSWRIDGSERIDFGEDEFDIVAEYVEPQPQQPLRWVENCKPDKPGIWAWRYDTSRTTRPTKVVDLSEDDCQNCSTNGIEWCYFGPIPEILPPVKKVVERLWLEAMANGIEPQTVLYRMHWCVDDNAKAYPINWIRTDNTREREV